MKTITNFINEQLITEHIVNCISKDDMRKYGNEVWNNILEPSYRYCGGIKGVKSIDDLIGDSDMWKLTRKDGRIVSVIIYSTKRGNGRKICLFGKEPTKVGSDALKKQIEDDFRFPDRKVYAGICKKPVEYMIKQGGVPLPANAACDLMNAGKPKSKWCIPVDEYWYKRPLSTGEYQYKVMFVAPKDSSIKIDNELADKLIKQADEYAKKDNI